MTRLIKYFLFALVFGFANPEQKPIKVNIVGKVLNKNARHNLCFADEAISANYESGQGTVVAFDSIPITKHIRESLPKYFGDKAANKKAEGNYYFDLTKTGIGFHGDGERRDVIGVRSGQDDKSGFPIHYQWFYKNKPIGKSIIFAIHMPSTTEISDSFTIFSAVTDII